MCLKIKQIPIKIDLTKGKHYSENKCIIYSQHFILQINWKLANPTPCLTLKSEQNTT